MPKSILPRGEPLGPYGFAKYHALGNDYLIVDALSFGLILSPEAVRLLCDRHRGVGSDGLLLYRGISDGRHQVEIHNPDGRQAERSGNGLRIFARFLYDCGYAKGPYLPLLTPSGPAEATLLFEESELKAVRMQMGQARFGAEAVHLKQAPTPEAFPFRAQVGDLNIELYCCSMGNPHAVRLVETLDPAQLRRVAPLIEQHPQFTRGINVQFAQIVSRNEVRVLVWERGAHETQASGSSSCAVAAVLRRLGKIDANVTIVMPGGELQILVEAGYQVTMTGPAEPICRGETLLFQGS